MTNRVSPRVVEAFYQAYVSRDPARLEPFLDDDIEWMVAGPVDIFAFCGLRSGKAAVLDVFTRVSDDFDFRGFDPETLLIDENRAAILTKMSAIQRSTGRVISYHCAQFLRFENGKLVSFRVIMDSLAAAEQVLGSLLRRPVDPAQVPLVPLDSDVVAIG